jgi:hypothetical protein
VPHNEFHEPIEDILRQTPSQTEWGVAALGSNGDVVFDLGGSVPFEALSIAKLGIDLAGQQLEIGNPEVTLRPEDIRPGNGVLQYFPEGYTMGYADAERLALSISDNTASRMMTRTMGGPHAVNEALSDSPIGDAFERTGLVPTDPHDTAPTARYFHGDTTPVEAAILMREVVKYPPAAEALSRSDFQYGMRRYLDGGPETIRDRGYDLDVGTIKNAHERGIFVPDVVYDRVLSHRYPAGIILTKEGTDDDDDPNLGGQRHEVAQIGAHTVSAFSRKYDYLIGETPCHPAHNVHAAIGEVFRSSFSDAAHEAADK